MKFKTKLFAVIMGSVMLVSCTNVTSNGSSFLPSFDNTSSTSNSTNVEVSTTTNAPVTTTGNTSNTTGGNQSTVIIPNTSITSAPPYDGNYYNGISDNLTGNSLKTALETLMKTGHRNSSYEGLKDVFIKADKSLTNQSKIKWFYTGTEVSFSGFGGSLGQTNREHVWPKAGGKAFPEKSEAGSDGHHLRPTETGLNSTRGSKSFDEVPQTASNIVQENRSSSYGSGDTLCYTNGNFFYPAAGYRGQTARIIFYVATRWGTQYNLSFVDSAGSTKTIGKISTLIKWNLEEPVSEQEMFRNDEVYKLQGNRNAFIDHPEYVCKTYGDFNATTRSLCNSSSTPEPTPTTSSTPTSSPTPTTNTPSTTIETTTNTPTSNTTSSSTSEVVDGEIVDTLDLSNIDSTDLSTSSTLSDAKLNELIGEVSVNKRIALVGESDKVYYHNGASKLSSAGLKFGSGSGSGKLSITLNQGETFSKVVIACAGWSASETSITINNQEKSINQYGDTDTADDVTVSMDATNKLEIVTGKRAIIKSITFYK